MRSNWGRCIVGVGLVLVIASPAVAQTLNSAVQTSPATSSDSPRSKVRSITDQQKQIDQALADEKAGDDQSARLIWSSLADESVPIAETHLGQFFLKGRGGVCKDETEAAKWLFRAANQGFIDAEREVGYRYYFGQGVPKDLDKAREWLTKAANRGDAESQQFLGDSYAMSNKVKDLNYAKAVFWYEKAGAQGRSKAAHDAGWLYKTGRGVQQNYAKAAYWYQQAASEGYGPSQFELGRLYENGQGVTQDYVQAYKWYALAATIGHVLGNDIITSRDRVAAKMTQDQIAQAKAAVETARSKIPEQPNVVADLAPQNKDGCSAQAGAGK